MKSSTIRTLALTALALLGATGASAAAALVGHSGLAGNALDAETTKAVLLGKSIKIGTERVIVVIVKGGPSQDAFLQARVGMNASQFQNHWRRLFMTGGGTAPKFAETEEDAAKLVAETPGAIAILDSARAGSLVVLSQ